MSQTLEKILNAPHAEHRVCAVSCSISTGSSR
jgi:hypothetical protein